MARTVADEKKSLREILSDARNYLRVAQVDSWSSDICSRVFASPEYQRSSTVSLYSAKNNEVLSDPILDEALHSGRRVFYPRIEGRSLKLVRILSASELKPGRFGIREPCGDEAVSPVELKDTVVCVPGLAFSPLGQRLGRGGGYYDRLLAAISPAALLFGLAYSFQLLDCIPETGGDRRVHCVFTESAVYVAPNRAAETGEQDSQPTKEVHPRVSLDGARGAGDRRDRNADREPASEPK
jgi:5-formyltetrahydrofolate cyclo-ligase